MSPRTRPATTRYLPKGLAILHEDPDLLVVDKPVGLLTMGTDTEKEHTAFFALTDYVRRGDTKSRKRIYLVHRLDRETSGVLLLAKTEKAKRYLKDHWREEVTKVYLAVVHGRMPKQADTIESYLLEEEAFNVHSTFDRERGRLSRTAYRVLKETKEFSLLEVTLLTGHKHQIRVHLAESGHPIVGDPKYGDGDKTHKRLALHALSIGFKHPFHGRACRFEAPAPPYFKVLVGGWEGKKGEPAKPERAEPEQEKVGQEKASAEKIGQEKTSAERAVQEKLGLEKPGRGTPELEKAEQEKVGQPVPEKGKGRKTEPKQEKAKRAKPKQKKGKPAKASPGKHKPGKRSPVKSGQPRPHREKGSH
jgi:tRNA pseudouridine32 synthase/23S rRNA pseudouridine746 synthase/23S rRNA pseudouridine1911/1915/1917 synthase